MDRPIIALLTDFGTLDTYVGVMKGVIAGLCPEARVIDLTHEIPPGDIRQAAFKLWQAIPYFPRGTVFVAVVDPGVGTERRPVLLAGRDAICIGPDNGLFTYLLATGGPFQVRLLSSAAHRLPEVSATFHGRDIFAPAAAHVARGEQPENLGPATGDLVRFSLPRLELVEGPTLRGEVLHADRFGNWITNLGRLRFEQADVVLEPWLPVCPPARMPRSGLGARLPDGTVLCLRGTFGEAAEGEALAYIGSEGLLEIAIHRGRASHALPLASGQMIDLGYDRR